MKFRFVIHVLLAAVCVPALSASPPGECNFQRSIASSAWVMRVVDQATALSRERKDAEAAQIYRDYLARQPNDSVALVAYAGQLLILRDGAGAQAAYERVLELPARKRTASSGQLHEALGRALYAQGKYTEAVTSINVALSDPCTQPNPATWGIYSSSLLLSERAEDASKVAVESVRQGSRDALTVMVAIEAQMLLKRYEDAARIAVLAAQEVRMTADGRESLAEAVRVLVKQPSSQTPLLDAQARGLFDSQWYSQRAAPQSLERMVPLTAYAPSYPREAARRGIEGWVDVIMEVDPQGKVLHAKVLKAEPPEIFDEAALASARSSTFRPTVVDGQAVSASGVSRYNFLLDR